MKWTNNCSSPSVILPLCRGFGLYGSLLILNIIIGIGLYYPAQGQSVSLVHLDKPYYVAGETIYYQVYLPAAFDGQQGVFQALIFDHHGVEIHSSYLKKRSDNRLNGSYKTSNHTVTGNHQLVVMGLWEASSDPLIARAQLPIYSTDASASVQVDTILSSPDPTALGDVELNVSIKVDNNIQPRAQVKVAVEVTDGQDHPVETEVSIAVTDIGLIGDPQDHHHSTIYSTPVTLDSKPLLSQFITLTGNLESGESGELLTFQLPATNNLYYATTEDGGKFQLLIPEFYGKRNLRYISHFSEGTRIELSSLKSVKASQPLMYTPVINEYIRRSKQRRVIYQLFNKIEASHFKTLKLDSVRTPPDKEYLARNYPFPDLPTFCRSISTQLKYMKGKDGQHQFKVFDPESRDFFGATPLFIVDSYITKDVEFLASLDFQTLEKISMYYDRRSLSDKFGFAGFGGVIEIESIEGNIRTPEYQSTQEFELYGLQPEPVWDSPEETNHQEPMLKPQLYWNPSLATDARGRLEVSYLQSDDLGNFQIEVLAQSQDGRRGYQKVNYRVPLP